VPLELAKSIDWSKADTHDLSDDALRLAIAGTLANAPGAADVLARRFGRRCVRKIIEAIFGKYPEIPEAEVEEIVEDKAADVVMQVQAGKLTEFTTSPSDYLFIAVDNEIKDRARRKKRHEVALTQLREQQKLEAAEGLQPGIARPAEPAAGNSFRSNEISPKAGRGGVAGGGFP
jgi:hypothetical protein